MPHFINPSQQWYLTTNPKVLSTLLSHQSCLEVVHGHKQVINNAILKKIWLGMPHFLLIRNPYKRLESFYKDKLRRHPSRQWFSSNEFLACQRIFCPYIQINDHELPTEIRAKLLSVSFAQFIKLLPQVYHLDEHLHPQTRLITLYIRYIRIGYMKFDRILKIESSEDLAYLQNELSIDLSIKPNNTDKIQLSKPWSPALRHIVNNLYQADFEAFNYEMLTA